MLLSRLVRTGGVLLALAAIAHSGETRGAVTVFEASGADPTSIQPRVDAFRLALGTLNPPGTPKPDGRREINWDGVPAASLDPLPPNFFNVNSPRGLEMATTGSRLKVSGDEGSPSFLMKDITVQQWGLDAFQSFSPQKIFAPLGSTSVDIVFFVPGTQTRATVSGFGAVFLDVDDGSSSRIDAWDASGRLIASRWVLPAPVSAKGLSFLGFVVDGGTRIARVRVTAGVAPLDAPFQDPPPEAAAVDDFIYGEPQALSNPLGLSVWLPVVSRTPGANNSVWRTDVGLLNASGFKASYEVRLTVAGSVKRSAGTLAAGESLTIADVVGQLAGFDGVGPLEIVSDQPLKVTSRVFNSIPQTAGCYPGASFGQSAEAVSPEAALGPGQSAFLPQLTEDPSARTNIAMTNIGATALTATVTLHDSDGKNVGSYDVALEPGEWKQENRPFSARAGLGNVRGGWAQVAVKTGAGLLAYATVIDNATNDPSYVAASR